MFFENMSIFSKYIGTIYRVATGQFGIAAGVTLWEYRKIAKLQKMHIFYSPNRFICRGSGGFDRRAVVVPGHRADE